ncbi:MAG: GFA family protein [Steroidobacteraceae bacterium]
MSDQEHEGGCQCGAVRYRIAGHPVIAAVCHCSMCRRANAAPAVAWAMFQEAQVTFVRGTLTSYRLPWVRFADDLPRFPEFPPFA